MYHATYHFLFFRYNTTKNLSFVRDYLLKNEMSTERVITKYEKCDSQLQSEIKNRRGTSSTNLAFSIILHQDIGLLENQLKILFRPNHAFCLHVDAKSPESILVAVQAIVDCYKKVWHDTMMIIPAKPVSTYWGHISLLESDLKCFELLQSKFSNWSHVINLAGSELPIQPIGKIESTIRRELGMGLSFASSHPLPKHERSRIELKHELKSNSRFLNFLGGFRYDKVPVPINGIKKESPPYDLTVFKGLKNVILSRSMVYFILNNGLAIKFRKWLEDTLVPDESFYATMIRVVYNHSTGGVRQDLQ